MSQRHTWLRKVADSLRSALKWADQSNPEKQKRYRQALRRRRFRTICIKLFFNILFLFSWSFVNANGKTYKWTTILGGSFWIDFAVYAGVSAGLPLFLFIGLLRKGILVSQVWFEAAWLLAVSGFDIFFICQLGMHPPPTKNWNSSVYGDPYQTVSLVLYGSSLTSLAFDLICSLLWSGYVSILAWRNPHERDKIWLDHSAYFPWARYLSSLPPIHSRSSLQFLFGTPQDPSPRESIPNGVKRWIQGSTMFRRFAFEPPIHSIIRGVVALLFWIVLFAYGIFNCVVNPVRQFTSREGLPIRTLTTDSHPTGTFGHIAGFIALDVVPYSLYGTPNGSSWRSPPGMCDSIFGGTDAYFNNPDTGGVTPCDVECGGLPFWNGSENLLQIEARWDCGPIWDRFAYKTSIVASNNTPSVTVTWNSAYYEDKPLRSAGLFSVPANPNEPDYNSVFKWGSDTPREWKHGLTFNLTAGQTFEVDVGRQRIYGNRASFLDLIGVGQDPNVFATYPIISISSTSGSSDTETSLTFHPAFGAYDDEIVEEYLKYTVLSGLSTTGGLYSAFEVIFLLIFGRALSVILFGGKDITPFGKIASVLRRDSFRDKLLEEYPGIDRKEPKATCEFLHDFILDMNPLDVPEPNMFPAFGQAPSQTNPGGNGKDGGEKMTMPTLPHQDSSFVGGFRRDEKAEKAP